MCKVCKLVDLAKSFRTNGFLYSLMNDFVQKRLVNQSRNDSQSIRCQNTQDTGGTSSVWIRRLLRIAATLCIHLCRIEFVLQVYVSVSRGLASKKKVEHEKPYADKIHVELCDCCKIFVIILKRYPE